MSRPRPSSTSEPTAASASERIRGERPARPGTADIVSTATDRLRGAGREAVGITGTGTVASLRETLKTSNVGIYPVLALGLLVSVEHFHTQALTIMGPELTAALGISRSTYAAILLVTTLTVTLATLPMVIIVQHRPRRAAVTLVAAFGWAILTAMTGFVVSAVGLLVIAAGVGATTASVRALHQPLLLDSYPPPARMRVLSFYRVFDSLGQVCGPLIVGLCTVVLDRTWRGVFLGMGMAALVAVLAASRLRDPGFGPWDTEKVKDIVRADAGAEPEVPGAEAKLGFFEISRQLMLIPTIRRVLAAWAVVGMLVAPFLTYLAFFLREQWGMGPGARAAFNAVTPIFGIVGLLIFSRHGERMFRRDPAELLRLSGTLMGAGITMIAVGAVIPLFVPMVLLFGCGLGVISVMIPAISLPMYSIVPAHMRPHLGALQGIYMSGIGGMAGLVLLGGIDRRFGTTGAILSLVVPGIAAGLILRSAAGFVDADLDRMVDSIVEGEEVRTLRASGSSLPLLACRNVDFSYGRLQVLFGADFTVDDGEMVALLGTNGAGKSTLLRVVSGLGLPSRGSVRFQGADITYVDAERRVRMGITQIPGGKAVFGPMSVIDNLRCLGHIHGRNRKAIDQGIEESFGAFPRLETRQHQLASTLSGGEQQMLGLATAFIVRPRLLLIDELSLGLAPSVVGELLEMVRRINAAGTSIVLVEQSVNIALSLVDHAYFMEKGEVRFDGVAADLLDRPDLLRSVFLEGASKGLAPARNGDSA